MRTRATLAVLALLAASGCTVGPNFVRPQPASPKAFGAEPGDVASRTFGGAVDAEWWSSFGDPELTSLVKRLAAQSLDLKAAAERIAQAEAQVAIVRSQAIPHVGGAVNYRRERQSPNGPISNFVPSPTASLSFNEYEPELTASWQLDLFGRIRRETEAARADVDAEIESRHALALAAISDLARTYMLLRQTQAQIGIVRRDVANAGERDRLVRQRFAQGAVNDLEVAQADAQLASTERLLPPLLQSEAALANAIALLLAAPPRSLDEELAARPGVQPAVPPAVPVGIPGDLIRRRPDIRLAEARLHAATARTGVAIASFYPDISFTGDFGLDSLHAGSLFDWASRTLTLAPTLNVPIFEGGRLTGNLALARSRQREVAVGFEQAVLQAWHDVDNALTAYARAQQSREDAARTLAADQRALVAAQRRFDQGAVDFLDVVDAQEAVIDAQNDLVRANAGIETGLVALYRALGGGWQAVPDPAKASAKAIARRRDGDDATAKR